jgi:hypothetical protein
MQENRQKSGSTAQIRIARMKSSGAIRASAPAAVGALKDATTYKRPNVHGDRAQRIRHERWQGPAEEMY